MDFHIIKVDAKVGDTLGFFVLSDVHKRHINHARNELLKSVDDIRSRDYQHKYVVDLGDAFDLITIGDKRYNPNEQEKEGKESDSVNNALEQYAKDVEPIKDLYQVMIPGNHELSYRHRTSFNSTVELSKKIGRPEINRYSTMCVVLLRIFIGGHRRYTYSIMLEHGSGSGVKDEASAMRKADDQFKQFNTDVCFMGHIHIFSHHVNKSTSFLAEGEYGIQEKQSRKHLVTCSGYLHKRQLGTECYAEDKTFADSTIGHQWLELTIGHHKEDCHEEIRRILY